MLRLLEHYCWIKINVSLSWFGNYFWTISCPETSGKMCGKKPPGISCTEAQKSGAQLQRCAWHLRKFLLLFVCFSWTWRFLLVRLKKIWKTTPPCFNHPVFHFHPQVEYFDSHEQRGFRREESKGRGELRRWCELCRRCCRDEVEHEWKLRPTRQLYCWDFFVGKCRKGQKKRLQLRNWRFFSAANKKRVGKAW